MEPIAPPEPTPDRTPPEPSAEPVFRPLIPLVFIPLFLFWMCPLGIIAPHPTLGDLGNWAVIAAFAAGVFTAAFNAVFCIRVSAEGVKARNSWGWSRRVSWDQISQVGDFNLLPGYPCLKIVSTGGIVLVAPLFISHYNWFEIAVLMHSPAGNPLRVYLEARRSYTG